MQETGVQSLGQEDLLEKEMATHSSILAWKILWSEELQQYVNPCELPDVQTEFRKSRGTRDQIANSHWIIEKAKEFQKNIYFCFIDHPKSFVWITTQTVKNSERDWNSRAPDLPPEKSICRSGSNSRNWTWNKRLLPNQERSISGLHIVTLLT